MIPENAHFEISSKPQTEADVYESSLAISDMELGFAGSYECFVTYESGRVVKDTTGGFYLTVPSK